MSSGEISKDNSILLTLPNVSVAENESEESSERNETFADGETAAIVITTKQSTGQRETLAADHAEEEERFLHQHFKKADRLSPELQDVYKILMQLPSFSHSSWDGFNATGHSTFSPVNRRNTSIAGKSRKNSFATGKFTKRYAESVYLNGTDSFTDQNDTDMAFETNLQRLTQPSREVVKMHSINLYQSILPSSLFARRKPHK